MICPLCKYEYREIYEMGLPVKIIGEKGPFWTSPLQMEKRDDRPYYSRTYKADARGCPSCKAVFIDD